MWDFGDGGTSDKQDPIYIYKNPGTYDVTLTVSNGYSTQISTYLRFVITVYGDLTAQFDQNQTAGPNPLTVQFTDTTIGNPTSWLWDFGDGGTSTEKNPVHTFSSVGTHNVVLTVSHPEGSLQSPARPITVYDPITAQFTVAPSEGPAPLGVQFTDTSTGSVDIRFWEFGDGASSVETNPVHAYAPGNYTANLTVSNHLRPDLTYTTSGTIVAYGIPDSAFTASKVTGAHPLTVQFTDASTGNAKSWAWDFNGDGVVDSTEPNPTHTFENEGTYVVRLRVANPAGEDPTPAAQQIWVL
jgi:PKD repeat protein